jgi:hypothetical protein
MVSTQVGTLLEAKPHLPSIIVWLRRGDPRGYLGSRGEAELGEEALDVTFGGPLQDHQLGGDLLDRDLLCRFGLHSRAPERWLRLRAARPGEPAAGCLASP